MRAALVISNIGKSADGSQFEFSRQSIPWAGESGGKSILVIGS